jgi:hypothetical protein
MIRGPSYRPFHARKEEYKPTAEEQRQFDELGELFKRSRLEQAAKESEKPEPVYNSEG